MKHTPSRRKPIGSNPGFTLIELIAVITIIGILLALVVPSVLSIMGGRDLSEAVSVTQGLATSARQQAITKGTMVALLISGPSQGLTNPQQMVLLQAAASGSSNTVNWNPSSSLVQVPMDVQATPLSFYNSSTNAYVFSSGTTPAAFTNFATTVGTQNGYSYIFFYPDGSVLAPIGSGSLASPYVDLKRVHRGAGLTSPDSKVLIQQATGRANVYSYY